MIGAAEAAVDDDGAPARLHGRLSLLYLDGHVAVDDVARHGREGELLEHARASLLVVDETVVRIGRLLPGALVREQRPLERPHLASRERREASAPEEVEEVERLLLAVEIRLPRHLLTEVEPRPSGIRPAAERDLTELPPLRERHTAVEEQIAVAAAVETPLAVEERDMAP